MGELEVSQPACFLWTSMHICACVFLLWEAGGVTMVDSVGRALKPMSTSVSATLIAYGGIDLWWVQGHCTRSSCLPTLASRQGPVNLGCGWRPGRGSEYSESRYRSAAKRTRSPITCWWVAWGGMPRRFTRPAGQPPLRCTWACLKNINSRSSKRGW